MANPNESVYCAMIHGGLNLDLTDTPPAIRSCCLRGDNMLIEGNKPFWQMLNDSPLRTNNSAGKWDSGCQNCQSLEKAGMRSFRQGMNDGLEIYGLTHMKGPARIDLRFDTSCNLACRTCGPHSSTFWQKHLQNIGEWDQPIFTPRKKHEIIYYLSTLDLSNLKQVVFCGGETLLGQEYWDVAGWLTEHVPDAKNNLTLCFQTNGTQPIQPKNYTVIDRCKLVKLHVSLDGTDCEFEYLRWPASWQQVTDNLFDLRRNLPSNVMFLIEQCVGIFNILSFTKIEYWVGQYFPMNRYGDPVDLTRHMVMGMYGLENCSQELINKLHNRPGKHLIPENWQEKPKQIAAMIDEIKKFDKHRNQSLERTFPEVFECFKRFW